ncbi:MAG: HlyD family efflux transporter periplasmic adaptor subunit [Bacteroidales bacterium]|nr:HlyD family efflux transporter periplasmic adaptor subunit [Bacteroidales bacterium]
MDRIIEKKKGLKKKHIPYILGAAALLFFVSWLIFGDHSSTLRVEVRTVSIETVQNGLFNDYIRLNGQVQPINIIQLSAIEGGMVDTKLIEEGAMVKQGDVIIRLTNPMLSLQILDSEAQLAEKQNWLRNTLVDMERERLNLRQEKLRLDLDVERRKRKFEQYQQLHDENLTSKEEYLQAKEDYEFGVRQRDLVIERQRQDSIFRGVQVEQMEESLANMRRNMTMIRERVENLNVKAPIGGQLGLLDVEIGQSIGSGQKIGQINVLSDYKIEAMVDEHYIDRVRTDLAATFERQDKRFNLRARKIYPEVRGGQFKTDFVFTDERPDNIRTGQTYYLNLELGQPSQAILIPRGAFYQSTGGRWIYVVSADGTTAQKRAIRIGKQNPQYYEVLEGLDAGERVIVSSYETFGNNERLILK